MKTNFKSPFVLMPIALILFFFSCNLTDESNNSKQELNTSSMKQGISIGEQHNIMLSQLYNHLDSIQNLDSLNLNSHVFQFFDTSFSIEESNIARDYYIKFQDKNYDIYKDFTPNLKTEKDHLMQILDNAEFANISELRIAIDNYTFLTTLSNDERYAWNVFTDVLYHSFDYWSINLSYWEQLLDNQNVSLGDSEVPCSERDSWFSRNWCKVKGYVVADASGAAAHVLISLAFSNPIIFGGVVAAGLASSTSRAIYNLVIGWF
uniref:hypothetical protein n=2 Tax=Flavobacterium sp. TaxID=239 RepID=UPI00404964C1